MAAAVAAMNTVRPRNARKETVSHKNATTTIDVLASAIAPALAGMSTGKATPGGCPAVGERDFDRETVGEGSASDEPTARTSDP